MNVFLSWSGERSRRVAQALRDWLPNVVQALKPWLSAKDIATGARWSSDVASKLDECRAGILCITPDNIEVPWLLFEAGALSKTIEKTFVCPYLFGLRPSDLKGPLVQFQAAEAKQEDTREMIQTLNGALGEHKLQDKQLDKMFDTFWPELERNLQSIHTTSDTDAPQPSVRQSPEEIRALVRARAKKPFPCGLNEILADVVQKSPRCRQRLLARAQCPSEFREVTLIDDALARWARKKKPYPRSLNEILADVDSLK